VKNRIKLTAVTVVLAFVAVPLFCGNLPFSGDISIKNSGMSGSYAPFINDSFSPFVNPAGLGFVEKQEIRVMYHSLFAGGLISAGSYALPVLEKGTFSASLLHLTSGDIMEKDMNNSETGKTFTDSYTVALASYGFYFYPNISAGINVKFINHSFYDYSVSTYGADLGFVALLPYNASLSLYAENIIKPVFTYSSGEADIMPVIFSSALGVQFSLAEGLDDSLKLSAGLTAEENTVSASYYAGAEYSVYSMFFLRGGIRTGGFSAGTSIKAYDTEFSYSYIKKPLDFIHRFSLSYSFGSNIRETESRIRTREDKARYELVQKIRKDAVDKFRKDITAFMKSGDLESAKTAAGKALVWAPYDTWFIEKEKEISSLINLDRKKRLLKEADSMIAGDSYIDAMVKLKEVLSIDPDNKIAAEKFKKAKQFIETLGENNIAAEAGNRKLIKQHFEKGLDNYTSGNYEKAVSEWDKVLKASPLQNQVYNYIKKAESKIRRKEEQKKTTKILKARRAAELYNKAVMLHTQGRFEESISAWKKLLEADPKNTEAKEYLERVTEEFKKMQKQELIW